ncbi:hypothetical protein WDU94_008090 [Cyamophila willieti]
MSSGGSYDTPVVVKEERLLCCGRARSMTEQDIASLYSLLEVSSLSGYHKLLRRPKAVRERHLTVRVDFVFLSDSLIIILFNILIPNSCVWRGYYVRINTLYFSMALERNIHI